MIEHPVQSISLVSSTLSVFHKEAAANRNVCRPLTQPTCERNPPAIACFLDSNAFETGFRQNEDTHVKWQALQEGQFADDCCQGQSHDSNVVQSENVTLALDFCDFLEALNEFDQFGDDHNDQLTFDFVRQNVNEFRLFYGG